MTYAHKIVLAFLIATGCAATLFTAAPASANKGVLFDAATHTNGKTYLFKDFGYWRLTGAKVDEGYPKAMNQWRGLPNAFMQGIDAALFNPENGKLYFFKGSQYVRLTGTKVDEGYPLPIARFWTGLPARFHSDIDAAMFRGGHAYFFKGAEYVRFTGTKMDAGYPANLPGGWQLPESFAGAIKAAHFNPDFGGNYFFTDHEYARLSDVKLDPGYPKTIQLWWNIASGKDNRITEKKIKADMLISALDLVTEGVALRLDNYNGRHHISRASYLILPKSMNDGKKERRIDFTIPEVNEEPVFYYINDIYSNGTSFGTRNDRVTFTLSFESEGTELPGRCFHRAWCDIVGDDNTIPDVQWNDLSVSLALKPQARGGQVYLIDPRVTVGGTPQAGGICDINGYDICDAFGSYKSKITSGVQDNLGQHIMSSYVQNIISDTVRQRILDPLQIGYVEAVALQNGEFVFKYRPRP